MVIVSLTKVVLGLLKRVLVIVIVEPIITFNILYLSKLVWGKQACNLWK